nr:MAG TPA: hypothetical protein [Caudoviricetes sp.]
MARNFIIHKHIRHTPSQFGRAFYFVLKLVPD